MAPRLDGLLRGGGLLLGMEAVAVRPVHKASNSLIPPPTWQGLPAGLEVVRGYEV